MCVSVLVTTILSFMFRFLTIEPTAINEFFYLFFRIKKNVIFDFIRIRLKRWWVFGHLFWLRNKIHLLQMKTFGILDCYFFFLENFHFLIIYMFHIRFWNLISWSYLEFVIEKELSTTTTTHKLKSIEDIEVPWVKKKSINKNQKMYYR